MLLKGESNYRMNNELYHSCRWCKWYQKNTCRNDQAFGEADDTIDFYKFYENGHLSAAIEEGYATIDWRYIQSKIEEKTVRASKATITSILDFLKEEVEEFKKNSTESIDESVSQALNNFNFQDENTSGIEIKEPYDFYCKYFL